MTSSQLSAALFIAALLAGCGGASKVGTTADGMVGVDLGGGGADDLAPAADLAKYTGPVGCSGYAACLAGCSSSASCAAACQARVTMAGKQLFDEGLGCGQAFCLDDTSVPARCALDAKMTALVDPAGTAAGTCNTCLANAVAGLFGASCLPANSPDCNPSGCAGTVDNCKASTP